MKVFIDSNIWLRWLVKDTKQAKSAGELIKAVEVGLFQPYTSTVILLEVNFALISYYNIKPTQALRDIETILRTRGLTLIEKTNLKKAIDLHKKTKIKLVDCLIANQCPLKTAFITFDRDFKKIPNLDIKTPAQILEKIEKE